MSDDTQASAPTPKDTSVITADQEHAVANGGPTNLPLVPSAPDTAAATPADQDHILTGSGASLQVMMKAGASTLTAAEKIKTKEMDSALNPIDAVFRQAKEYAIYRSGDRILVCFSDTESVKTEQIKRICGLLSLRDHLQYLIDGEQDLQNHYQLQIADALWLGLEDQVEAGKKMLADAIADATDTLQRTARADYLTKAGAFALLTVVPLWLYYYFGNLTVPMHRHLIMATAAGAIGALLSVAISTSKRNVALDVGGITGGMDGIVRVLIGVICGGALYLFLASGALNDFKLGGATVGGNAITGAMALLIGFAAGFTERLVPDLLEKTTPPNAPQAARGANADPGTNKPAGGNPVPSGSNGARAQT